MKKIVSFFKNMFGIGTILYLIMLVLISQFWLDILTSGLLVRTICLILALTVLIILSTGAMFWADFSKTKDNWFSLAWTAGSGLFCAHVSSWGESGLSNFMWVCSVILFAAALLILFITIRIWVENDRIKEKESSANNL